MPEIYIVDPQIEMDSLERDNINTFLRENPTVSRTDYLTGYFNEQLSYAEALAMLSTPGEVIKQNQIQDTLGQNFYELVWSAIPTLTRPDFYDETQAKQVTDLYHEVVKDSMREGLHFQNPFESLVSLRHFSRQASLSSKVINGYILKPFKYGSLQLEFSIRLPNNPDDWRLNGNIVKKARRHAVHGNQDRGRLQEKSIRGNITRIKNERRMISVTPSFIQPKEVILYKS